MLFDIDIFDKYLNKFKPVFSGPQFSNFKFFAKGLLTTDRKIISRIAETNNYSKNQSTLNRFLTESPWSADALENRKKEIISSKLNKRVPCFISIDDTLFEKSGKNIALASTLYDHTKQGYVWGHCLVTAHLVNGKLQTPLTFRHYVSKKKCRDKFRTKPELAAEIINSNKGLADYFLLDSWYFSKKLVKTVGNKKYIAMAKSNRKVLYKSEWMQARNLPFNELKSRKAGKYVCKELVTKMNGIDKVRVICTKKGKKRKFIATNDFLSSVRFIVQSYAKRWNIEVLHKDLKQKLGIRIIR